MSVEIALGELPVGASIKYDNATWTVLDVRRHAMTTIDGTAWLILGGWKAAGKGDPPKLPLSTRIAVDASFS